MNPDTHRLEPLSTVMDELVRPDGTPVPKTWKIFAVGEIVEVNETLFVVAHIGEQHVLLEPHVANLDDRTPTEQLMDKLAATKGPL